jgi:hypothetical protein
VVTKTREQWALEGIYAYSIAASTAVEYSVDEIHPEPAAKKKASAKARAPKGSAAQV